MSSRVFNKGAFSDFLNPAEASEASRTDGKDAVFFGGYEGAERVIMGLFEYDADYGLFPIAAIEILYNTRFSQKLSHRDFLGSILALGINRQKIGDILLYEGKAIVFVHEKMLHYIVDNLATVANTKVKVKEVQSDEIMLIEKNEKAMKINVSSLRLDAVISAAINISRGKSAILINQDKVFVNWNAVTNVSRQVKPGDTITVRGSGRIKIIEISGKTKKDRIILEIKKTI